MTPPVQLTGREKGGKLSLVSWRSRVEVWSFFFLSAAAPDMIVANGRRQSAVMHQPFNQKAGGKLRFAGFWGRGQNLNTYVLKETSWRGGGLSPVVVRSKPPLFDCVARSKMQVIYRYIQMKQAENKLSGLI